ncbi:MAG: hypothetical protein ACU0BO_19015, partial [Limimaricola soesokkakensis]|uniref:hypothetical protein n=1 Tax=Limimaricola soesokkakensis TaxID=1343159 RepID=UPI00405983E1
RPAAHETFVSSRTGSFAIDHSARIDRFPGENPAISRRSHRPTPNPRRNHVFPVISTKPAACSMGRRWSRCHFRAHFTDIIPPNRRVRRSMHMNGIGIRF